MAAPAKHNKPPRTLEDNQFNRALRWLRNQARYGRKPPRHIAEKIRVQEKHLTQELGYARKDT